MVCLLVFWTAVAIPPIRSLPGKSRVLLLLIAMAGRPAKLLQATVMAMEQASARSFVAKRGCCSKPLIVGSVIPDGSGNISQILGGLQWITDPDDDPSTNDYPRVVNMSFGASGTMDYLKTAIKNLRTFGILPIASIGNDGEGSSSNPGNMPEVLSVGSVDYGLKASGFSGGAEVVWENEDDSLTLVKPDLCAPGKTSGWPPQEGPMMLLMVPVFLPACRRHLRAFA